MPEEQQSSVSPNAAHQLYNLAIEIAEHHMIYKSFDLVWVRERLEAFPKSRYPPRIDYEAIIDAFISYRDKSNKFQQLETNAILGHALILRALGPEAAYRIGCEYFKWGRHATLMCTALLLWVGDNPELKDVEEKFTLNPDVGEGLLFYASGNLSQLSPASVNLRQRLSLEMLSFCEIPLDIKIALNLDKHSVGGSITR
jgi:hypothetical protein